VGDWQPLVYGILVAVAAVYVPNGLLGVLQSGWRRMQLRRHRVPAEGAGAVAAPAGADPERALAALGGPAEVQS
jgi:branched-chain amino acid transport system permease protein